eukprot:COSAG02_NODE_1919_length_10386_cov_9.145426_2_plen_107_part_00
MLHWPSSASREPSPRGLQTRPGAPRKRPTSRHAQVNSRWFIQNKPAWVILEIFVGSDRHMVCNAVIDVLIQRAIPRHMLWVTAYWATIKISPFVETKLGEQPPVIV